MKANELKATDLMVGDYVICYHPSRPQSFERVSVGLLHTLDQQEHGHIKEDSPLFRIVQPIPLTPEILEKNGFETKKIMPFEQEFEHRVGVDGRVELDNRSEYIRSNNTWSMYIRGDRGFTSYIELSFLHELQHQLKHCKINKMITI